MNINHQELEDFLFDCPDLVDFKAELTTNSDIETLTISIEVLHSGNPETLTAQIAEGIKNKFEVSPAVEVLARGTLAKEFENSVKAPRFVDRRA